jgi:ABC-2 type transport system permease protein
MAVLEIARVNLLRVVRDRANLFFVFLMPLLIIVAMGVVFGGGGTTRLGIVWADSGPLGDALVETIRSGEFDVDVRERASLEDLRSDVERGELHLGLLIPPGYDDSLRAGQAVELTLLTRPGSSGVVQSQGLDGAVAAQTALVRAARLAADHAGLDFDRAMAAAAARQGELGDLEIRTESVGGSVFPTGSNPFAFGAQSQTVLFMFLTSMTAATQLLLTRQLGVSRRMLATPTPVRSILMGELTGRFAVAIMQGLFIVLVSSAAFGVGWGEPLAAASVIVLFALVGTGAAMIVGVFVGNVDQASAIAVLLGLVLGALGGAMVPLELFGEPMATVAHLTPHAWAIEGLRDLAFEGAGIVDILLPLLVLAVFAAGLVTVGVWGLRRALTRA